MLDSITYFFYVNVADNSRMYHIHNLNIKY